MLDDLVGQLVDFDVLVVLEALDLVQPATLLHHGRDGLQVGAGHLQQVVDAIQNDLEEEISVIRKLILCSHFQRT